MKPRILNINPKLKPEAPAPNFLSPLLSEPGYRNILHSIMRFLPIRDRVALTRVNRLNRQIANAFLHNELNDPVTVLQILSQLDKYETLKFLRKFFFPKSEYYHALVNRSSLAAYAVFSLVAPLHYLDSKDIDSALTWLKNEGFPPNIIHSVRMTKQALLHADAYFMQGLSGELQCYLNLQGFDFSHFALHHGGGAIFNANLSGANLSYAKLANTEFIQCSFLCTALTHANMQHVVARDHDFCFADMQYADLRHANLAESTLHHTDLRFANLQNTDCSSCDATGIKLQGANLENANFTNANMANAGLHRSNLTTTNLQFANLLHADLSDTRALGTNLLFADLNQTNREQMYGLTLWKHYAKISDKPVSEPAAKRYKL